MGYGDELMVSGRARVMQQSDPRKVMVTYQGVRTWSKWTSVWENNPRIAGPNERGDFQELKARGADNMRPYHTAKTADRWHYNLDFRPDVGELYLTDAEIEFAAPYYPNVIVEPTIKPGASPNKQWGRWREFVRLSGIPLTQLGPPGTVPLDGVDLIETQSFRLACAVLANAKAYVGHEGGLHHAAAALGIPGVVIFGGFISPAQTGYDLHRNLFTGVDPCGMRTPCKHCADAMAAITPEQVMMELETML